MSSKRKPVFYAVSVLLALLLALVLAEVVLSFVSMPRADGRGAMSERWFRDNWRPLNEFLYRDGSLQQKRMDLPAVFFLGDSFTTGHGVTFEDTFYFKASRRFLRILEFYNLARNGASTRQQHLELARFVSAVGVSPGIVVHQYFPNDIEDYFRPPPLPGKTAFGEFLRKSELMELVLGTLELQTWGKTYTNQWIIAFRNDEVRDRHLADIASLHRAIRAANARVIFVVFPVLDGRDYALEVNDAFLDHVFRHFRTTCAPGDAMINVDVLTSGLLPRERVVNILDPHPSPRLHQLVAEHVTDAIMGMLLNEQREGPDGALEWCERG